MRRTTMLPTTTKLIAVGLTALIAGACSGDDPDPEAYFAAFDRSQIELTETVEAQFSTPLALEVEEISAEPLPDQFESADEAVVHEWFTEFWTAILDATEVHRDEVDDLDVPDRVSDEHDEYVSALDALTAQRDTITASIDAGTGVELVESMWDPVAEIDAATEACVRMKNAAALLDIAISAPMCTD